MSRRIDATRLQVGQRIFARVALDVRGGWSATGYAMRIDLYGDPGLALWNGQQVNLTSPNITVDIVSTEGHHAPWEADLVPRDLPTEQGSLILARVAGATLPMLLARGLSGGAPAWFLAGALELGPVTASEIGDDWVQIDPTTLRPIEDPS